MVKRREPTAFLQAIKRREPSPEEIEAFANGVDKPSEPAKVAEKKLDPNAKRDFKSINISLNEYEYKMLDRLSIKLGRSKLNVVRFALAELEKE